MQRIFSPSEPGEPQLSAVLMSCKPTHKQTNKAKISPEKSFLLASHTHSPEDEAGKAGHPCPGFLPPCLLCSSCFLVSLLFPQPDPAAPLQLKQHETSQPLPMLSQLLPANSVHELLLPIHALSSHHSFSTTTICEQDTGTLHMWLEPFRIAFFVL